MASRRFFALVRPFVSVVDGIAMQAGDHVVGLQWLSPASAFHIILYAFVGYQPAVGVVKEHGR